MGEYPVKKTDSEWQAILSPEQVGVFRGQPGGDCALDRRTQLSEVREGAGMGWRMLGLLVVRMGVEHIASGQKKVADQASSASSGAKAPNDRDRTRTTTPSTRAPTVCIHLSFSQLHSITPSAA